MLPKELRLVRGDIPLILKEGQRFNTQSLLLYSLEKKENSDKNKSKFSFSVSKKIAPTATERNLFRRRGYSVVQKNIDSIVGNHHLFFVFKKGPKITKFKELEDDILRLLSLAGVLR